MTQSEREAKDLREGDVFLGANGELLTLVDMERIEFPDGITVYNFTVDGNHNYFVIAAGKSIHPIKFRLLLNGMA